ncbi:MAG: DUF4440 domain-containing protein [Pseudomonadales bacterium]|nr:DUF4440 domain-containing protein [Pseudomonadales bacterium]
MTIEQIIENLDRAISEKQIEPIKSIYNENACLVKQPGDLAHGVDEVIAYYEALFSMNIPMTISTQLVKSVEANDLALVTTKWTLEGVDPEGNKGSVEKIASMVFSRSGESKWSLLIDNPFGPELLDVEGT